MGKLIRAVLRGRGYSNGTLLPDSSRTSLIQEMLKRSVKR